MIQQYDRCSTECFVFHSEPIVQICIDSGRNTLYTRSEQGSLHVYDLGKDANDAAYVADLSASAISKRASEIRRSVWIFLIFVS